VYSFLCAASGLKRMVWNDQLFPLMSGEKNVSFDYSYPVSCADQSHLDPIHSSEWCSCQCLWLCLVCFTFRYITRIRLDPLEECFITWALVLIALSILGFIFISPFYLLVLAVVYIIVFSQLYSGVNLNIRGLDGLDASMMVDDEDSDPSPLSVAEEVHSNDRKRALFSSLKRYFTFLIVNGVVNYLLLSFIFPNYFLRVIQEEIGWLVVVIGIGKSLMLTSSGRKRLLGIGGHIDDVELGRVSRICEEEMSDEEVVNDDGSVEENKFPFVIVQGPCIDHLRGVCHEDEGYGSVFIGVSERYLGEADVSEEETHAALQRTVLELHSLRSQHGMGDDDPLPALDSPHLQRYAQRRGAITRHSVHESSISRRSMFARQGMT
jgi:hypothetical protein